MVQVGQSINIIGTRVGGLKRTRVYCDPEPWRQNFIGNRFRKFFSKLRFLAKGS